MGTTTDTCSGCRPEAFPTAINSAGYDAAPILGWVGEILLFSQVEFQLPLDPNVDRQGTCSNLGLLADL